LIDNKEKPLERAIIVGVAGPKSDKWEVQEHLDELAFLAEAAGAKVCERVTQERKKLHPAYYIGKGKVDVVREIADEQKADVIIFDDDLTPAQAKNLGQSINKKVLDRSGLILDIFARRAQTREARTQVELAQLRYLLPRLTRQWTHLSRQVGGIGTRGPGETQLEVDRRLIRKRIGNLEKELDNIERQRSMRRKSRDSVFKAALVGYTNVGKSTLMNAMTDSDVFIEDQLFATLDATIRTLPLTDSEDALLIDTVGFIRKLPHHLVASFKSTLEEARDADVLVHVIDISHPCFEDQMKTVQHVFHDLSLDDTPVLHVFNKIDMLENNGSIAAMREKYPDSIFTSASKGMFLGEFKKALIKLSNAEEEVFELVLHAGDGESISRVYDYASVMEKRYEDENVIIKVKTSRQKALKLKGTIAGGRSGSALSVD